LPVYCGKQLYQHVYCSQHSRLNAAGKVAFAEALPSESEDEDEQQCC